MELPEVYVCIITYDRPKEIRRTIFGLLKKLRYPREKTLWHLADDSSPGDYLDEIKRDFKMLRFTATITDRKGWGTNVNKALVHCFGKTDFVFQTEDDYVAEKEIDLESGVRLLMSKDDVHKPDAATARKKIGLVRYDGIAAHWLNLELREAEGHIHYMRILHDSPGLNVYSHRPHLKHRRFHDAYGNYAEGMPLAETENNYAFRVRGKKNGPWLTVLPDGITKGFVHIGKSRQGTDLDVGFK